MSCAPPSTELLTLLSKVDLPSGPPPPIPAPPPIPPPPIWPTNFLFSPRTGATVDLSSVDRAEWEALAMRENPEILEIRERLRPLSRAETFGRIYNAGKTEVKHTLTPQVILQLVMQHLYITGNKESVRAIEKETGVNYIDNPTLEDSRLRTLLRIAVKEVDKVFDFTISDKNVGDADAEAEFLGHLGGLELGGEEETDGALAGDKAIWEEEEDNPSNIILKPVENDPGLEQVTAGTLNKLVERLTKDKGLAAKFRDTFLLTYRSFTTPDRLLEKLRQRYNVPVVDPNSEDEAATRKAIQLRVVNVVRHWLESAFFDFNDSLVTKLTEFIKEIERHFEQLGKTLRATLQRKLDGVSKSHGLLFEEKHFSEPPPDPIVPRELFFPNRLSLNIIDELELARQLTIQTWKVFARIKPVELQNQAWNKKKHTAPNVIAITDLFNTFSGHVAYSILSTERLVDRAKVMARYVKLADCLRGLSNFHMLMAVVAAFSNAAVTRLKVTKDELGQKTQQLMAGYMELMSSDNNYQLYRAALKEAGSPCIPFVGVTLTDLTFIEDGNKNNTGHLINFHKRQLVGNQIQMIQQHQQSAFNLAEVYQIQTLLKNLKTVDENELWRMSKEREPKGADKKSLK